MPPEPKRYSIQGEIVAKEDPYPESRSHLAESFVKRILLGHFDEALEDLLEAAHHRKREIRERRHRNA